MLIIENSHGDCKSFRQLENIVNKCREESGYKTEKKCGVDSSVFSKLFRQELSSFLIYTLINDLKLMPIDKNEKTKRGSMYDKELGFEKYGVLAHGLKEITYHRFRGDSIREMNGLVIIFYGQCGVRFIGEMI